MDLRLPLEPRLGGRSAESATNSIPPQRPLKVSAFGARPWAGLLARELGVSEGTRGQEGMALN